VTAKATLWFLKMRLPNSARRMREEPEMSWLNGLNGLKAPAAAVRTPPAAISPGVRIGLGVRAGITMVVWPGVSKLPVAKGASSSTAKTSW